MNAWKNLCWRGTCICGNCLLSFVVWSLWLALSLLLCFQLYIAFAHELSVPPVLIRSLESRLASSGLKANFGRTSFDPSGRLLIENARLSIGSMEEPAVTAQSLYVSMDPWALLAGRFEPRQLHASGVSLWVPAMLSATGRSESIVQDVDFTVTPNGDVMELHQFTARLAGMEITGQGTINLAGLRHRTGKTLPMAELLANYYSTISRRLPELAEHMAVLQSPTADILLQPSANRGAIAHITLQAQGAKIEAPTPISCGPFQVATRLPLWGQAPVYARLVATADAVQLPHDIKIDRVHTTVRARFSTEDFTAQLRRAEVALANLNTPDVDVHALSAHLVSTSPQRWQVDAVARVGSEPVTIRADLDPTERSGQVHAIGSFDPELMESINRHAGRNIRRFIDFGTPPKFDLHARFAPGGKFTGVEGRVFATQIYAYNVTFDSVGGHITFDGTHFLATDAEGHIGENFARGSFEQDLSNLRFRFLLKGRLRPPDIGGWFHDWWPRFWDHFDFTTAPPDAEVDVQGRWGHNRGWETSVFVFANSSRPMVHGVQLDHALTLIYLRPHYYDGMEIFATKGGNAARGWFVRHLVDDGYDLKRMDFDFESSLDLHSAAGLVGPDVEEIIAPFTFARAPELKVSGFLTGSTDPTGAPVRRIKVSGSSMSDFTFHDFPLHTLSFRAELNGNDLLIDPLRVGFAQGATTGRARINVTPGRERVGFDLGLKGANLRQATSILDTYTARRRGDPVPAPGASPYIRHSANVTLDLGLSAEGDLNDPYSYMGTGNAELSGGGLGEIRLLGLLSELLNFTSLRFNNLRANFSLEKNKLVFPEVSITGSNSSVSAHGTYALDKRALNFNARLYPFEESKFILKNVVGAVLTPLSTVLAVKLTGRLDKPSWAFVIGPTNFLRNLTHSAESKPPAPAKPSPQKPTPAAAPVSTEKPNLDPP